MLAGGASSQLRFCFTKPAPQKGALPPWKGELWDLPRLLGDLYRKPPETFTQSPAEKTGRKQKAGPPAWENQAGSPVKGRDPIQSVQRRPHPIYGKRVWELSGKKPANPHET